MKAILVIEKPVNMCRQCRLCQKSVINHNVIYWCSAQSLFIEEPNEIQSWCPLKTIPEGCDVFIQRR